MRCDHHNGAAEPPPSVLGSIEVQPFDADADRDYHVTRDLQIQVLGLCSHRRAQLEREPAADQMALARLREQQQRAATLLQHLDPADTERVAQVRQWCRHILDLGLAGRRDVP
ncbi:hypothetical protein [Nonomuraea sp. NPDC003754]